VPHSTCPIKKSPTHPCDTAAILGANALLAFLPASRTYVRVGETPRDDIDLNRVQSRATPFRKSIRNLVRRLKLAYDEVVILDSHSYPKKLERWQGRQLYLMDLDPIQAWVKRMAMQLATDHKDGDVVLCPAEDTIADILLEFREAGHKGVVIEWCEKLTTDQIMQYAQIIAEFVQRRL
jgi:hypothetical protein